MKPFLAISAFRQVLIAIGVLYSVTVSAAEMKLTPDDQRLITAQIQDFGYNCPLAKMAWAKGEDAYGTVIKVFCGPRDRDGVYEHAVFRFTFLPNNKISVVPWRD